jgi:putative ABC transport system permease protein
MLRKKMIRDIKQNLSQFITIFLMVFIGIMAYSGIESYMEGMKQTANNFYGDYNLQDLNIMGELLEADISTVKEINGVKNAEGKLNVNTVLEDDSDVTISMNFIEENDISKFYIVEGKEFEKDKKGIWLDNFFAEENNLKIGDTLKVKYDGYVFEEEIVGLINVPDHVYDVKDESQLYPDHKTFGFAYASTSELEGYIKNKVMKEMNIKDDEIFEQYVIDFNYKDYIKYNYIMVDVESKEKVSEVKSTIEDKIENVAIINIEDTASYAQYQGEVEEGETYIGVFSGLFLFIALLSVITTMTRVVKKQRVQIGTLKALGFKQNKIVLHYISYSFWISLISAIAGLFAGRYFIGNVFIGIEMSFFQIPNGVPVIKADSYIVAILVVLCVSLVTYLATRKILKEKTAEILRNEIPKVKNNSLNITTNGIFKKMSFNTKWNIRDMLRNKTRTITGIVGVTACAMLIVCSLGMLNSMNYFIELQFDKIFNFDYKLSLKSNINNDELKELTDKYGDNTSESLYIEIKDKDGNKETNNIFVTDSKNFIRFVDDKDEFIEVNNDDGVYVTYKLAKTNGYKIGDEITWHISGDSKYYTSKIVGFNKDPQNQNVTITKAYLESLGIEYKPDSLYTNADLKDVKDIDNVEVISNIDKLKEGMNGMLETMKTMIGLIIVIAIVLGTVIIYNLGILSYTEKQYQFATLKVLGFKDKQIEKIFIKQNNIISVISIILGLPAGYYLTDWLFKTAIEDSYDFGAHINIETYVIGAIGTFVMSYLVSKLLAKKIKKIDMVTSLKGNE